MHCIWSFPAGWRMDPFSFIMPTCPQGWASCTLGIDIAALHPIHRQKCVGDSSKPQYSSTQRHCVQKKGLTGCIHINMYHRVGPRWVHPSPLFSLGAGAVLNHCHCLGLQGKEPCLHVGGQSSNLSSSSPFFPKIIRVSSRCQVPSLHRGCSRGQNGHSCYPYVLVGD